MGHSVNANDESPNELIKLVEGKPTGSQVAYELFPISEHSVSLLTSPAMPTPSLRSSLRKRLRQRLAPARSELNSAASSANVASRILKN